MRVETRGVSRPTMHNITDASRVSRATLYRNFSSKCEVFAAADVIVDIGNCYAERDVRQWIGRTGERIGLVQVSDVTIGTIAMPGAGTRGLPGSGELPIEEFLRTAIAAGYAGPFEIEFLGLGNVDEDAVLASLDRMDAMLHRLGV